MIQYTISSFAIALAGTNPFAYFLKFFVQQERPSPLIFLKLVRLLKEKTYIGYERIQGFSGLPARCQEKALSLISSGIDSPVASFELIKRGVKLDFIHFHSYPAINQQSIENVKDILTSMTNLEIKSYLRFWRKGVCKIF